MPKLHLKLLNVVVLFILSGCSTLLDWAKDPEFISQLNQQVGELQANQAAQTGATYAAAARAEAAANADRDAWGNSKFNTYQFNRRPTTGYSGNSAPSPARQYATAPPISPIPTLPSNSAGTAPRDSNTKRYFPNANNCVYIDGASNSLADFVVNKCSFPIAVWYCLTDSGHPFQCGRGGATSAIALEHIAARDKASTLKGHHYKWIACGSPSVDVYLFALEHKWDGQNLRGKCNVM